MSTRQAREGTQPQGVDERIAYRLDVSNWGNDPTNVSVLVKDRDGCDSHGGYGNQPRSPEMSLPCR